MQHTTKHIAGSQIEINVTVTPEEYQADLERAALRISERSALKGFRKGKAPYDIVQKEIGDMRILEEALESIIARTYSAIVNEEKLDVIGMPKVSVEKAAPRNDLVYTAVAGLLPEITLPDFKTLKVKAHEPVVDEKQVTETIDALRGMQAVEIVKAGKAEGTDKLVLDMDMSIDHVAIEGGQTKDHQVYLSEDHYIPGFNAQVTGLSKGETKTFTLTFPKDHFQKNLAGKEVEITVTVKEVYSRELPEMTDDFAKRFGMESVEKLKEQIATNVREEAEKKAAQQTEIELLNAIIEKTEVGEIPEALIDSERKKMFHELVHDLERMGVSVEKYLADIKKTEEEIFQDFKQKAIERAKAALISRAIAKAEGLAATPEELKAEMELIKLSYPDNETVLENLKRDDVRDTIAVTLQNKKVMEWLKKEVLK